MALAPSPVVCSISGQLALAKLMLEPELEVWSNIKIIMNLPGDRLGHSEAEKSQLTAIPDHERREVRRQRRRRRNHRFKRR